MKYLSKNESDTVNIARDIAAKCVNSKVLCLQGDLGSGKTVFARALIRHLCDNQNLDVPSPTFTLVQTYDSPRATIWHFDLYRLEDEQEIYELGWEDALNDENIVIIEWPERLGPLAPPHALTINFEPAADNEMHRIITIEDKNFG